MKLYVSMGIRSTGKPSDPLTPHLVEMSWPASNVLRTLSWESPPEAMSSSVADQEFTAASWTRDGLLLQPTHTEVLWIDPLTWTVVRRMSHPLMYSVHSACERPDGGVVVSAAGNQMVLCFDRTGRLEEALHLGEGSLSEAYPGVADFRRLHHDALKPHAFHPNHVSHWGGDLWVTCFETRAVHGLRTGRIVELGGIPHDGRLREGLVWFTRVDGHVMALDPVNCEVVERYDLQALSGSRRRLGWCRGVDVRGDTVVVGMTTLRSTAHREVARWLLQGEAGRKLPTRLVVIDRVTGRIEREVPLDLPSGGTIYGINFDLS